MALRPRPLGEFGGVRAVRRERQRHRRRQLHDGVGGLGGADPEPADDDGDHGHLGRLGAVGIGGIDRERLQAVGHDRDHAVAGLFQQPLVDAGHRCAGAGSASALSAASPPITTSWRLPLEPSMMVTVLLSPLGCLRCGFRGLFGVAGAAMRVRFSARLAQRDTGDRLAAEGIVGEKRDGEEGNQKQAEQHRQRLHRR